mgnify:CR=1 FL=1
MQFDFNEILNQGVAIFVMCYFMWFNNTTMKEFRTALQENTSAISKLCDLVNHIEGLGTETKEGDDAE